MFAYMVLKFNHFRGLWVQFAANFPLIASSTMPQLTLPALPTPATIEEIIDEIDQEELRLQKDGKLKESPPRSFNENSYPLFMTMLSCEWGNENVCLFAKYSL